MELIRRLFSSDGFMPHGHCYFWNPAVLRLHIISDALITLAYLTIPLTLVYIVRKRRDIPFDWIFACFGIFIVACGATHAMEIWSIWHPTYWLSGSLKGVAAAASLATAMLLIRLIPKILAIPSPNVLREANRALGDEILERQAAEEQLRQLKRQHDLIFNSIGEGIHWIDRNGAILFENAAAARMLGWEISDLIGRPAHATMHHTRANGTPYPQCECQIYACLTSGVARRAEDEVFWRKDGTSFPVEYTATPVRGENGEVIAAVVVFSDTSARKRAAASEAQFAAELSRGRQRLDAILNSVPAIIFEVFNPAKTGARTNFVSNHVETVLGYTPEEWNATPNFWFSRIHPDDQDRVAADSVEVFAGRRPAAIVFRWMAKDGRIVPGETHLVHIHDEAGEVIGVRGFTVDVTERVHTEAEMERLNKQLVDVSRQAGMAEVATSVLHNVGNVLNSVNVSCSVISTAVRKSRLGNVAKVAALLQENASDLGSYFSHDPAGQQLPDFLTKLAAKLAEEQASILHELQLLGQNIEHIKDIVAMQQSYARVSGVAEIIDVIDLVEDSLRMNAGALTRHEVEPVREFSEVPPIVVEKHKVLQILVNLIRNAKYACDESGREDKQMTVRVAGGEDGVRIAIIDNGVGIPPENLTRIFSHGFTTRKDGHGFGLHSAVLAAQEMGGRLTAQSGGTGAGATFTLELPFTPLKEGAKGRVQEPCLAS